MNKLFGKKKAAPEEKKIDVKAARENLASKVEDINMKLK